MRTLALSGWGQPHDALATIAADATHLDYARHESVDVALAQIAEAARSHDTVIGWSLGGQLAVRAIATGLMRPRKLVLIGTPFEFVKDGRNGTMGRMTYDKFRGNYASHPERTLRKAYELILHGDRNAERIRGYLERHDRQAVLAKNWLAWLDRLGGLSAGALDLAHFPDTLLVHGANDAVVEHAQARRFAEALPQSTLAIWEGCGHAPHWHNPEALAQLIRKHQHV